MALEIGDIVELKSGGPKMTVTEINVNGEIRCTWFNMNDVNNPYGGYNSYHFHKDMLKLV